MKMQAYLLLGLLFALVIAAFAVVNGNPVEFNYIFGKASWPLVLIILGSAAIGGLSVGMLGFIKIVQLRAAIKRYEQQAKADNDSKKLERVVDYQAKEAQEE
ncbi:lipopolysaccharide assembly LapA domain-containing protein [Fictibacillus iocasae]|uniref:Lipopolysaccharide assembly LapA domain-containing protein n=1 Tax=Fictibacillus iocasae TaxID=2715437 RepID=A0ABW2NV00_9BACL